DRTDDPASGAVPNEAQGNRPERVHDRVCGQSGASAAQDRGRERNLQVEGVVRILDPQKHESAQSVERAARDEEIGLLLEKRDAPAVVERVVVAVIMQAAG